VRRIANPGRQAACAAAACYTAAGGL